MPAVYDYENTRYRVQVVDGPIQPLPTIEYINDSEVKLGKALFTSKLLSKNNEIACSNCHDLERHGADGLALSPGVGGQLGTRNTPTVFNAVFNFRQFWDGRSHDLAEQVSGPIHNPIEMASNWPEIIAKLKADAFFSKAFKEQSIAISEENIVHLIQVFEESLVTNNAPIDLFLLGDNDALTPAQKRGHRKFIDFGCATCHQGKNIGGNLFHRLGRLHLVPKHLLEDKGRYLVTGKTTDEYVFKVPSLRNVEKTGPYFHDGSAPDLETAIDIMAKGQLGLELNHQDIQDIKQFLKAFTGQNPQSLGKS